MASCENTDCTDSPQLLHKFVYLATETAGVFGMLGDFHLLHHFTKRSSVTSTILSDNSDLLGALGLEIGRDKLNCQPVRTNSQ